MRLLNIKTFEFEEFFDVDRPPYIIASHRWFSKDEEPTFKDIKKNRMKESKGYKKIKGFCSLIGNLDLRGNDGLPLQWLWIDTCCIDKKDLVELSESIGSMYQWYRDAYCCLALLADVTQFETYEECDVEDDFTLITSWDADSKAPPSVVRQQLKKSQWFQRGWTLQELIAPHTVIFLNQKWDVLGYKGDADCSLAFLAGHDLTPLLHEITKIPEMVLNDHQSMASFPVEERLRWMEGRETSRPEDGAYCLMGICDVRIHLMYGEGEAAALNRLLLAFHRKDHTFESELLQAEKLRALEYEIRGTKDEEQEAKRKQRDAEERQKRLEDELRQLKEQQVMQKAQDAAEKQKRLEDQKQAVKEYEAKQKQRDAEEQQKRLEDELRRTKEQQTIRWTNHDREPAQGVPAKQHSSDERAYTEREIPPSHPGSKVPIKLRTSMDSRLERTREDKTNRPSDLFSDPELNIEPTILPTADTSQKTQQNASKAEASNSAPASYATAARRGLTSVTDRPLTFTRTNNVAMTLSERNRWIGDRIAAERPRRNRD